MAAEPQIVHPVPVEDIPGYLAGMRTAFLIDPEGPSLAETAESYARTWVPERAWGATDHGRWVATLRTLQRTLTVPGHDGSTELVDVDALTNVTVAATHRRRGLLTRMLDASLGAAVKRGDPIAILVAAEWPIYGRFGYAPAVFATTRVLHRSRRGSTVDGDVSRVRQVDRAEFLSVAPAVFQAVRRRRPGHVDRDGVWWDRAFARDGYPSRGGLPHNHLVHDGDDGPDGILAWTATSDGGLLPPRGTVRVSGAPAGATAAAHRDLWAYLTGLDLIDQITVRLALDDPVGWLLPDARTLVTTAVSDYLWLRLLDVPAALAARRYAVAGELVLEVTDPTPHSVTGRYRLVTDGSAARPECEPTTADPDLTVAQTALAAAYLGGTTLRAQRPTGTVTEHRPGTLALADAMFTSPVAPFNATAF